MFRRLFWLSLACVALVLLLGRLVRPDEASPPRAQAFAALQQEDRAAAPMPVEAKPCAQPAVSRMPAPPAPAAFVALEAAAHQPFFRLAFQAFHYSDEAG